MVDGTEEPTAEPTVEPTEGTTPEPVVPEPTPEPPDPLAGTPYAGKSAAELAKMVDDSQAFVKDRNDELGQLRNENAYYRSIQQQPKPDPVPQVDFENLDQEFLTNPAKTAMRLMDEKLSQFQVQSQFQQAQMAAPGARRQAMADNKELFAALSPEQMAEVDRSMGSFLDPRNRANPAVATSPDNWRDYASVVYMRNRGNSPIVAPPNPVAPVVTETPQATKSKGETSYLDKVKQKYRQAWSDAGYTAEQQERMAKGMQEGEK